MNWRKLGRVFSPQFQSTSILKTHAQCPTALVLKNCIRVYFSARKENQQSLPIYVDVAIDDPTRILNTCFTPIIVEGMPGTFDEHGIIPSYILPVSDKVYLYYAGWSQAKGVPYKNFTGLAVSCDQGNTFTKFSEGPCLPLNFANPLSATGPAIIRIRDRFECIYSTGTAWHDVNGHKEHVYVLRRAWSMDGINWEFDGEDIFPADSPFHAYCKPAILFLNGIWHMWFSVRSSHGFRQAGKGSYRLGYAWSEDFIQWHRDDTEVGITISDEGWDSKMICYPNIVSVEGHSYMFYNGDGFGQTGFGVAELKVGGQL